MLITYESPRIQLEPRTGNPPENLIASYFSRFSEEKSHTRKTPQIIQSAKLSLLFLQKDGSFITKQMLIFTSDIYEYSFYNTIMMLSRKSLSVYWLTDVLT